MVADSGGGIWISEVLDGRDAWARYAALYHDSGEGECIRYLTKGRGMNVYAAVKDGVWTVQVLGAEGDSAPFHDCLSCQVSGETLHAALSVAAGLMRGIRTCEIDYSLADVCVGVVAR